MLKSKSDSGKETRLAALRDRCLACRLCPLGGVLHGSRPSNVFSNMNAAARVMAIGQNPGRDEVEQGAPFVGASGKFFDAAMEEVGGLSRCDLYVSNVCKCFTEGNRRPTAGEMECCFPILHEEMDIMRPHLVIALGSVAFERLTGHHGIMKHLGQVSHSIRHGMVPVVPVLHPSPYNTNNPAGRKAFMDGMRFAVSILEGCRDG